MAFIDSLKFIQVIRDDGDLLNATPEDVLSGIIFVGKAKKFQIGNIPRLDKHSNVSLLSGEYYTVPFGYNSAAYTISAVSLADQTPGDASSTNILINKIAWVNGLQVVGAMPDNGAVNITLNAGDSTLIDNGYHNGSGRVTAADLASQTIGTITSDNVLINKIAWVNGSQVVGAMPDNGAVNITLNAGDDYIVPLGYHNGTGIVRAADLASQTIGTATETDIVIGQTAWVNGIFITGTVPKIEKQTIILPINGSYTIPFGIHPGTELITQAIPTQGAMTLTPAFESQIISLSGKYMTDDITLSGLDALNFNNFNSDSSNLYSGEISLPIVEGDVDTEIYRIPVDNWHDQLTNNIYYLSITSLSNTQGETPVEIFKMTGTIFMNNLNSNGADTNILWVIPTQQNPGTPNAHHLYIQLSKDATTNAHVFTLKGHNTGSSDENIHYSISVEIKEVMQLRQYGDSHDTN